MALHQEWWQFATQAFLKQDLKRLLQVSKSQLIHSEGCKMWKADGNLGARRGAAPFNFSWRARARILFMANGCHQRLISSEHSTFYGHHTLLRICWFLVMVGISNIYHYNYIILQNIYAWNDLMKSTTSCLNYSDNIEHNWGIHDPGATEEPTSSRFLAVALVT